MRCFTCLFVDWNESFAYIQHTEFCYEVVINHLHSDEPRNLRFQLDYFIERREAHNYDKRYVFKYFVFSLSLGQWEKTKNEL